LIGEATDIHALGLLLFEMLTGRSPFVSRSPADVLVKVLHDEPPPLRSIDRRIPRDLETICLKMLRKSPADRYPNVSALLEDLRRFEAGEPLIARRTGLAVRIARFAQRHWKIATTAVITAVISFTVIPPLFDKSFDELVQWGDEELASGNPDVAAQVYARALSKAGESQRRQVAERIVRTCRNMEDEKAAVELALRVVELVPEASFGPHDFLVAQALVARERSKSPSGTIDVWHDKPTAALELLRARLDLALAGGLPDRQRIEIEETLTAVNLVLSQEKPHRRVAPDYLYKLPVGSALELSASLDDDSQPMWNRARAGIALGKLHEAEQNTQGAIVAYQRAYHFARQVFPMYEGVKASIGSQVSRVDMPDAEECRLVSELVDALRRLSPNSVPAPEGRVEFAVIGETLPPSIGIELDLVLCDPSVEDPNKGLSHNLPRLVPIRQDRPVSIGVLDGTYRLTCRGRHSRWEPESERLSHLLQVDTDNWPREIKVHGKPVKLPPVRLRVANEVQLLEPPNGATVDLSQVEFTWQPVPGATRYQVVLMYTLENPSPLTAYFLTVETTEPRLHLAEVSPRDRSQVVEHLIVGRTGGWQIDAYDDADRQVGVTLAANRFLVAREIGE
jgi:hypothetical protein